jgi:hypothetical protein
LKPRSDLRRYSGLNRECSKNPVEVVCYQAALFGYDLSRRGAGDRVKERKENIVNI